MKKMCSSLLSLCLLLGLTACGQGGASSAASASASGGPTWQEQYDLGVRYLSEGSYAEAILAFTAAIDIDPKRPDAFIGRGDAYVGTAQLAAGEDAAELPEESRTAYESAVADYLAAIGLDKLLAAVYGKAADVYLALGDREAALAILQQGVDATGDADLNARLASMSGYGNRWDSAFWSWDGYTAYDDSSGELIASYQATEYNEQGLPVAGVLTTDQESIACKIEWNDLGQMVLVSQTGPDWSNEYPYSYDEQGRVLPSEAQTYEYDDQGRVVRETYTEQDFVIDEVYTYDGQGRVVRSVERNTDAWGTSDYTTVFTYND